MNKAVYTYWPNEGQEACGFNSIKDMALCLALSVEYSKKHFKIVELITNDAGKRLLINKYKIGFTSVKTVLNNLPVHPDLWAFAKMKAYSIQKEPFLHIDIDCILWQKLPAGLLKSKIFFQHKESFTIQPGYKFLVKSIEATTVAYFCQEKAVSHAFNCGVVGVTDLSLVKKWYALAEDFIANPANKHFWNRMENKGQMNYLFEQYFVACVLKGEKVEAGVLVDNFDFDNVEKPKLKFTHLWGDTKKDAAQMNKIKERLKREFPKIYSRINSAEGDLTSVFADVYKKGGERYKKVLDKAFIKHKVRSVVYLGYKGTTESKYIDVDKNVDFVYSHATKHIIPKCDMVIIKDLMPIWSGKQLSEFVSSPLPVRFVLDGRSLSKK